MCVTSLCELFINYVFKLVKIIKNFIKRQLCYSTATFSSRIVRSLGIDVKCYILPYELCISLKATIGEIGLDSTSSVACQSI